MASALTVTIAASEDISNDEVLPLPERDHYSLTDEEMEQIQDFIPEFRFLIRCGNVSDNMIIKSFEDGVPFENIINMVDSSENSYAVLRPSLNNIDKNGTVWILIYHRGVDRIVSLPFNVETMTPLIKTAYRKDLFKSVKITEKYDDIEVEQAFFDEASAVNEHYFGFFITNHGNFVFCKRQFYDPINDKIVKGFNEYLFPAELVYQHAKSGESLIDVMIDAGVDLTQYVITPSSNLLTLPSIKDEEYIPTLSDPSVIFAVTALISLGGFAAFAVKRPRKKETET